jgi:uncharacterized protein (TIGR00369 family)
MAEVDAREYFFSQFGDEALSDEEFVDMYNFTMPPGLRLMNTRMVSAAADRGEVVVTYELGASWVNVAGFVCGGYIAQALDQAATGAASLVSRKAAPSIEFKTNFLKAVRPGTLVVTGNVVHIGRSLAFTSAKAVDENRQLVATATVTSQLISAAALAAKR